jgi:hypothetical protein
MSKEERSTNDETMRALSTGSEARSSLNVRH